MKRECMRELIDIILDPAEEDEEDLKLYLQERGIDAERWRRKVLCHIQHIEEQAELKKRKEVDREKE